MSLLKLFCESSSTVFQSTSSLLPSKLTEIKKYFNFVYNAVYQESAKGENNWFLKKVYWNTGMPIIYKLSVACLGAKLSSCDRDHMVFKAWSFTVWPFGEKVYLLLLCTWYSHWKFYPKCKKLTHLTVGSLKCLQCYPTCAIWGVEFVSLFFFFWNMLIRWLKYPKYHQLKSFEDNLSSASSALFSKTK